MKLNGLKTIRKTFGFTMRDLADKLRVTANAINLWENGGSDVSESRLEQISEFFGIEKELLLKDKFNAKDMMFIEFARSRYKLDEYKGMIKKDDDSIDEIIDMTLKEFVMSSHRIYWRTLEGQDNFYSLKSLLQDVITIYSDIDFDEYDECDDFLRDIISEIRKDTDLWKKYNLLLYVLQGDEEVESWEDDFILFSSTEQILKKNIKDNVEQLYKLKLYNEGKYKPDWMDE